MKSRAEIMAILADAHGTEQYHRFSPIPGYPVATDGVMALAEAADCFWLLDVIGSYQTNKKLDPEFQVWKLTVNKDDDSAVVHGYNDETPVVRQMVEFTDFPLDEVKVYVMNGVILLPSEY